MSEKEPEDRLSRVERFVPNQIDTPVVFFKNFPGIGVVRGPDALVLVVPGLISFYIFGIRYALDLRIAAAAVGLSLLPGYLILMFLKPEYKDAKEWTFDYYNYIKRPSEIYMELDLRNNREKVPDIDSDEAKTDDTRGWTMVEEIFPSAGVVKLTNDQYLAMIEANSEPLEFGGQEKWNRQVASLTHNFFNTLDDEIQIFVTDEGIRVEDQVLMHKERLNSSDVTPQMEEYVKDRINRLRNQIGEIKQKKTYIIITVDETSLIESKLDVPQRIRRLGGREGSVKEAYLKVRWQIKQAMSDVPLTEEEKEAEQINEVINRVNRYQRQISGVLGGRCEHVTGEGLANVLKEYWEGISSMDDPYDVRKSPVVSSEKHKNQDYIKRMENKKEEETKRRKPRKEEKPPKEKRRKKKKKKPPKDKKRKKAKGKKKRKKKKPKKKKRKKKKRKKKPPKGKKKKKRKKDDKR